MAGEISLDVFNSDPFSAISLTAAIQRNPYQPTELGSLNLFTPVPMLTTALRVEERTGKLVLIPFSERGTAGKQRKTEQRTTRYFETPRLAHDDTIYAYELQNVVQFGQPQELMQVQQEVDRRLNGPTGLNASMEYTKEYMRLGAIQGLCLDPGTAQPLYNWFDEFQIAQPAEFGFNLAANVESTLRPLINQIIRAVARKAQGCWTPNSRVGAICGDAFYDAFTTHKDVKQTFLNWSAAADLRAATGAAFDHFNFGGVEWINYRGSDDNTTIKVPDNKVKFFPIGAPGVFQEALAPGEAFKWMNKPGQPIYIQPIIDRERDEWFKMEAKSYPLYVCTRPETLQTGRMEA